MQAFRFNYITGTFDIINVTSATRTVGINLVSSLTLIWTDLIAPSTGGYYLLEDGTSKYQLEDGSGFYILE